MEEPPVEFSWKKTCTPKLAHAPVMIGPGGGRVLHYGVRRGCAPVLGSFWPENSGIGIYLHWKISVIGVYFHLEFSGIGVTVILQLLVMGAE